MAKAYRFPSYEDVCRDFEVVCDGVSLDVISCRVSAVPFNQPWPGYQRPLDQTELSWFTSLDSDGEVTLTVTPTRSFERVVVRPLSKKVTPEVSGGTVTVTLPGPGQYSVEFDGIHHVLTVFVNPEKDFSIDKDDPDVLYFAPGVHTFDKPISLDSNQTLYLERGAVIRGGISAKNKKNISVLGYGIIDNGVLDRGKGLAISISSCENVRVEGITIVDSNEWSMHFPACENVIVDNIKLIGMWRYNSDGCDFTNCQNAIIRNSYLRNYDDCIVIKGLLWNPQKPILNILAENCVLWCDWGRAMEIGAETSAPSFNGVRFQNIDVIHGDSVMMDIQHGDRANIFNISFEDIRCEYQTPWQRGVMQSAPDEVYVNPDEAVMPVLAAIQTVYSAYTQDSQTGSIYNVSYKNIQVFTDDGRMPPSVFRANVEGTEIVGVDIEEVYLNGKRLDTVDDFNIVAFEGVNEMTFK